MRAATITRTNRTLYPDILVEVGRRRSCESCDLGLRRFCALQLPVETKSWACYRSPSMYTRSEYHGLKRCVQVIVSSGCHPTSCGPFPAPSGCNHLSRVEFSTGSWVSWACAPSPALHPCPSFVETAIAMTDLSTWTWTYPHHHFCSCARVSHVSQLSQLSSSVSLPSWPSSRPFAAAFPLSLLPYRRVFQVYLARERELNLVQTRRWKLRSLVSQVSKDQILCREVRVVTALAKKRMEGGKKHTKQLTELQPRFP